MFSRRSAHETRLNPLTVAVEEQRQSGRPLVDLTGSNPTTAGLPYSTLLPAVFAQGHIHTYAPEAFGLVSAREVVASHVSRRGISVVPADIMLTASTSEAYAFLFKMLTDPGDTVLVPAPSYPLLTHLAALEGVALTPYPLFFDGAWRIDLDGLRRSVTATTRAIIVVSPNNPTGNILLQRELAALTQLGLPLISDEVFSGYRHSAPPDAVETAAQQREVLTFSMGGLSKEAGLPQMKLAWTVISGPSDVVTMARQRLELVADTFLSVGTPVQVALPTLMEQCGITRGAIRLRCQENLRAMTELLTESHVKTFTVEGGWTAPLQLPSVHTDEEWALLLLKTHGVLTQPGYFYDFAQRNMLVVSLLTPPTVFREGIQVLRTAVSAELG